MRSIANAAVGLTVLLRYGTALAEGKKVMEMSRTTFVIGMTVAVLVLALGIVFLIRNMGLRRKMSRENRRYAVAMNNAYDEVAELDLEENGWFELSVLNGMLRRTKMHESLDLYTERFIREHVYKDDMAVLRKLLSKENLQRISDQEENEYLEFRQISPKGSPFGAA